MTQEPDSARIIARITLALADIPVGADFYALSRAQVGALIDLADRDRYRAPAAANGSRARYYHEMLQRRAGR
jgi:hypothetical protein